MAGWTVPPTDVMLKIFGAPHQTELVSSALRLMQAILDQGARVQVWTCGDATGLTSAALAEGKPPNPADHRTAHPSTATLVRDLMAAYPDRLYWYACRFCCEDRGAPEQIPEVRKRPPSKFWEHLQASQKVLAMGVF
jgi:sulfur relay (sulfurtransferase) complex TusBCD TusD component (DsrE family)